MIASGPSLATGDGVAATQQGAAPQFVGAPKDPSQACVLHVWPGENAHSSYSGWFHGGAVDGDRRGIKGYPAMHSDVLTVPVQRQLLASIDWTKLVDAPGLSVVVHDQPPAAQDDLARTAPLVADRPACYEELLVHSVLVERAAMSSSTVRVMVIAKKWLGQGVTPQNYSVMRYETVNLEAPDNQVVEASLKSGFVDSIQRVLTSKFFWLH